MTPYWVEYDRIIIDTDARAGFQFELAEQPERWVVTQRLTDPAGEGDGDWRFVSIVDLGLAQADGAPSLQLESLGRF